MRKAKQAERSKKPSYFLEIVGLIAGLSIFFISLSYNEKERASGEITYNDEGLVSLKATEWMLFMGYCLLEDA